MTTATTTTDAVSAVIDLAEQIAVAHGATPERLAEIQSCRETLRQDPTAALREVILALRGDEDRPSESLLQSWDPCDSTADTLRHLATDAAERLGICSAVLLSGEHDPVRGARGLSWTEYQCAACGEVLWDEAADNDFYD